MLFWLPREHFSILFMDTSKGALSRLYNGHLPKKRNSQHSCRYFHAFYNQNIVLSVKFFTSRNLVSLVTPEGLFD